jgi:(E)-4-hydroxy-3-methylbut-2-enyl-diphosphate synthase
VRIGSITIGAGHPIAAQSMTATHTTDVAATLAQANALHAAGAGVVRIAVDSKSDAAALPAIRAGTQANLAIDLQENYRLAIDVAPHVDKLRYNPGHLYHHEPTKPWQDKVKFIADVAAKNDCAMRVGVNCGSVDPAKKEKFAEDDSIGPMLASALEHCELLDSIGFTRYAVSLKDSDPKKVIEVNRRFAEARPDVPLHLGVTHAGPKSTGAIRSVAALSTLIANGIGDTLRISYASDHVDEVKDGLEILYCLGKRPRKGIELIACPTCGRIQVDLFTLVKEVEEKLSTQITLPLKVAVMGCIVNGPGEAEGADVAVFAGDRRGIIYVQGQRVANVPENEIMERLLKECLEFEAKVKRGEAKLGEKMVEIVPPDPIGELGSGKAKIMAGQVEQITVRAT